MIFPGQSLTAEPKNAPYENPPSITTAEDAIDWHLSRLATSDKLNALLDALELGLDVVTLTEGVLRGAVAEGRHSIDISLTVAPVIHEFIKSTADKAGIDYEEGFPDDTEQREDIRYQIDERKARKAIKEYKEEAGEEVPDDLPVENEEEMTPPAPENKQAGLMSRPTNNEGGV